MTGGIFEGSTDGTEWTALYTGIQPQINASTSVKIPAAEFETVINTFSYIRYSVPEEQYCNIAEIERYSTEIEAEPLAVQIHQEVKKENR